ncbi:hypothetical protein GOP47_0012948 [Adiantum capillus-veneris]|uniref:Matrin-type domain-containing protein n=1 Tax=Adiantum capillus-veneris TaxID=13818 RepID=A0A9D4US61_ADICA|nr:hypothetical protein GOP47_0012948 [Adiantum capillus-veneris]
MATRGRLQRILREHAVKNMITAVIATTQHLIHAYEEDQVQQHDHALNTSGHDNNIFGAFYDDVKAILRQVPNKNRSFLNCPPHQSLDDLRDLELLAEVNSTIDLDQLFSGEEAFGRFLDLHGLFHQFRNSNVTLASSIYASLISNKNGEGISPISTDNALAEEASTCNSLAGIQNPDPKLGFMFSHYLEHFPCINIVAHTSKLGTSTDACDYRNYLTCVIDYLISFIQRVWPLQDVSKILASVAAEFDNKWHACAISGWEEEAAEDLSGREQLLMISKFDSLHQLLGLGPKKLKHALVSLQLKGGGTVQERAQRLFYAVVDKSRSKKLVKQKPFSKSKQSVAKEIALAEMRVMRLCELLRETIEDTKLHVERKEYLQSYKDYQAEKAKMEDDANEDEDEDDEEEEAAIHNPLNIPIGVDGKPIPYWLYQLHGLGQEFKCEICGDASYWGRRAFEKHFNEKKHKIGMKCLGIPNSKIFHEITTINDAKSLWNILLQKHEEMRWQPNHEELEDDQGNVYDKKSYMLLKREGLF